MLPWMAGRLLAPFCLLSTALHVPNELALYHLGGVRPMAITAISTTSDGGKHR